MVSTQPGKIGQKSSACSPNSFAPSLPSLSRTHCSTFSHNRYSFLDRANNSTASMGVLIILICLFNCCAATGTIDQTQKKNRPSRGYRCNAIGSSVRDSPGGLDLRLQPIEQRVHLARSGMEWLELGSPCHLTPIPDLNRLIPDILQT